MKNGTTQIEFIENGSVTSPAGFLAAGVVAGFKKSKKSDFAMLFSQSDCNAAGTFTSNLFRRLPFSSAVNVLKNAQKSVQLSSTAVLPMPVPEKKDTKIPANLHRMQLPFSA